MKRVNTLNDVLFIVLVLCISAMGTTFILLLNHIEYKEILTIVFQTSIVLSFISIYGMIINESITNRKRGL